MAALATAMSTAAAAKPLFFNVISVPRIKKPRELPALPSGPKMEGDLSKVAKGTQGSSE
jgi:hypothetical protein